MRGQKGPGVRMRGGHRGVHVVTLTFRIPASVPACMSREEHFTHRRHSEVLLNTSDLLYALMAIGQTREMERKRASNREWLRVSSEMNYYRINYLMH